MDQNRMSHYVDRGLWALMIGVAGYASAQIQSASNNVAKLNEKVAVIINTMSNQDERLRDHEIRLRQLEIKK